jgi:hypothetical protein
LLKWPNQNPNLKVKSWQKLYAKRNVAVKSTSYPQPIGKKNIVVVMFADTNLNLQKIVILSSSALYYGQHWRLKVLPKKARDFATSATRLFTQVP